MKRKYLKWKVIARKSKKKFFLFIRDTYRIMRIRNSKRIEIRQKVFANNFDIKNDVKQIEALSYTLNHTLGILYFSLRFIIWPVVIAVILFLCFTFIGRVSETEIHADLYVSTIVLDSIDSVANSSTSLFNAPDSIIISNNNPSKENDLLHKFADPLRYQNFQEGIGFIMPSNALISVHSPDTNQTLIKISPHKKIDFTYNIYSSFFSSAVDSAKLERKNDVDNKFGSIDTEEELSITLFGNAEYKLKPIVTNQLFFNEDEAKHINSYILQGTINLLDTKGDSINLYQENYFSIHPVGKVKIYISKGKEAFRIQFTTKVSKLDVGSEYGVDVRDDMPLKIQTNYDKYPYLWLTIPVLLPVFFSLLSLKSNNESATF